MRAAELGLVLVGGAFALSVSGGLLVAWVVFVALVKW